ncbi:MAG TPA: protein phosphatase 2C domain-containing protein [Kofleriaceae bacterium]|nr:protein phosphatase 2C domain-containing protein [Kofleriaceae bacterium]
MAGRASIVGAAATHVGNVRDHNEDAHFLDADLGMFLVCDGMGGHAAGEVASALAISTLRETWASEQLHGAQERWLDHATPDTRKQLLDIVRAGVVAAHDAILAEAERDEAKSGMGTTLVGAMVVGGELVFAHAGDSRAYLVRDGISMQLTEDHTLLARLLAAGIDVDVSGEGARFRSMLTNALGIGEEVKVSTFAVPLADGDRFLLSSDGVSEYVPENEVGEILTRQSSPARAAQRLIDLALERGGADNATAVVVRVLEAGETPLPAEQRRKDDAAIATCGLWGSRVTPQQRLRALRIAIPRDHAIGEKLPAHALGDRVAWIIVEGELVQDGVPLGPGTLIYPESLVNLGEAAPLPERDALAVARGDVRALAIRADDFRELCEDDGELGEALLESLAQVIAKKKQRAALRELVDPQGHTDPQLRAVSPSEVFEAYQATDPDLPALADPETRERASTVPDEPLSARAWPHAESSIIAPAPPTRPSPLPAQLVKRAAPPLPDPSRPSPLPSPLPAQAPSRPSPLPSQLSAQAASRPSPLPSQLSAQAAQAPEAPGNKPAAPTGGKSGAPPSVTPGTQPSQRPVGQPSGRSAGPATGTAAVLPASRGDVKAEAKIEPKPEAKTDAKTDARAEARREANLAAKPDARPEAKLAAKPEAKTDARAEARLEAKPAAKTEAKPAAKPEARTEARTEAKPAAKPEARTEAKPAAKPEARTKPEATTKPEARPEIKPGATAEAKAEPRPDAKPAPRAAGRAASPQPRAELTARGPRGLPGSPWDPTSGPERARHAHSVARTPKGFAPPLTPPAGTPVPRPATPVPRPVTPVPAPAMRDRARPRPPTEPEIEAYLEIEADLPPESAASDAHPELAFGLPLRGGLDPDDDHESVSITIEEDRTRVTVTEDSGQTLLVMVTEPDAARPRAITAEDGSAVSGIISIPADLPPAPVAMPRRAKRHSDT